ncbi:hypothetical protein Avbf_11258 [Armadillidium vulgare]|nr:hypothetical protein Avbf_11258 [Armadillidium vulgare]
MSWHMAYHGIKVGAIRRMLDRGELLFAGELEVNKRLANRKSREDASDGSVLIFSLSVVYASLDELTPPISRIRVNTRLANRKSREDASDGSVFIFSPSVVYASLDELAHPISKSTKAVCPTCWMMPIFSCDCCKGE